MAITNVQIANALKGINKLSDRLLKATTSADVSMNEIQKDVAKELSSKAKRDAYCIAMGLQFKQDKTVTGRIQTCINKPATQRYILKIAKDMPLNKQFSLRTANKELLNKKDAHGKSVATQKQVDQTGVYHCFEYDKAPVKKPTQISKGQAWVTEFSISKEQYLANAQSGKIKFFDVSH